ncbi:hypothetical protein [Aestuariicoccus sp. MJ-SS9]|uniref:hypothetical protein n=1 Tax=Aestuariicoccus sp. MJ-SS9 TaxID=3079855 RepID=UPI00290B0DA4|nr:hypothetical protein [Aestuariicoccus sp. MJ-SS9]MDU8913754.1 hypothetical protein [Aestuariicoccus sp. MJ-SS9]
MNKISALFELRCMLRKMEEDVGLEALTPAEMDVFLAAHDVTGNLGEAVTSDQIRQHYLASDIAQATYHRALRSLVGLGLLEKAAGYKSRHYVVRADLVSR